MNVYQVHVANADEKVTWIGKLNLWIVKQIKPFHARVGMLCVLSVLQLSEAGLREMKEETGLTVTADMCAGPVHTLAVWEVGRTRNVIYH